MNRKDKARGQFATSLAYFWSIRLRLPPPAGSINPFSAPAAIAVICGPYVELEDSGRVGGEVTGHCQ